MSLERLRSRKGTDSAIDRPKPRPDSAARLRAGLPLFLQRQSLMGKPGDAFEQEADRVQAAVTSDGVTAVSSAPGRPPRVQLKPVMDQPGEAFDQAADRLQTEVASRGGARGAAKARSPGGNRGGVGPGQPLGREVRKAMEPRLGADLSGVRVHADSTAAGHARTLGARAFTAGNDIVFGENQFQPGTTAGMGLLAHELTHVVQQGQAAGSPPDGTDSSNQAPAIQRTPEDSVSSPAPPIAPIPIPTAVPRVPPVPIPAANSLAPPIGVPPIVIPPGATPAATPAPAVAQPGTASPVAEPGEAGAPSAPSEGGQGRPGAAGGPGAHGADGHAPAGAAPANAPGGPHAGPGHAAGGAGGGAPSGGEVSSGGPVAQAADTGAGALDTGALVLIDVELAEHQRWAGALGRVGEVASLQRAEFIAESVGSGFLSGAASGLATGLGMGLVTRAVPALGPVLGGAMAIHGLATRDWAETGATIGKFGQGSDTYETLANTIGSVAAVIDVISQVLTVINSIVGVVEIAAGVIAGGAVVAAFFTFGATLGVAAVAADVVATCQEISEGITLVTSILDEVNAAVLKPCETLFRALHEFTTKADPREVEAQGHDLSSAAAASGAALGAWAGGKAAHVGGKPSPPAEPGPPSKKPPHETPPPAPGEGPVVRFQEPPPAGEGAGLPPEAIPTARRVTDDQSAAPPAAATPEVAPAPPPQAAATPEATPAAPPPAAATPEALPAPPPPAAATPEATPAATPPAAAPPAPAAPEQVQLTLPGTEGRPPRGPRRPLTPDEIAPPDAHSAYLRRLRAEAEGGPPPAGPGTDPYNVARHSAPGGTPEPDLYQPENPRQPAGWQSHHLEQKAVLGRSISGYDPDEDVTAMMPLLQHRSLRGPQRQQEANPTALEAQMGTPAGLEEAVNIAMWGQRTAPPPGSGATPMLPEAVAGQTAMEHAAYLFETTPLSPEHGGSGRPTVPDYLRTQSGPDNYNIDWEGTFNQPDPYRAAQPPGTQFAIPGMEHLAPPPSGPVQEQLRLPGVDQPGPNPNQLKLPFDTGASPTAWRVGEGPTRSSVPLTDEQYQAAAAMAVEMGMPPDQIHRIQGDTSYVPGWDALLLGPDVHPLPAADRPTGLVNPANAALDPRAVIGHEVIGHREAALGGQTRDEPWHEELQASARAALHTPGLTPEQSWQLLLDSAARRRFQQGDGEIYIDTERYGPAAGPEPPGGTGGGPRPPGEPSVIIDYDALGMTPPEAAAQGPPRSAIPLAPAPPQAPLPATGAPAAAPAATAGPAPAPPPAPAAPSTARQIGALFIPQFFGPGGEPQTYAQRVAAHRARFTDDNQPAEGVERVNPNYPPPPATPAQINAIQNEIVNLLTVRAAAEREAERQAGRANQCVENQAPIQQTVRDTQSGISAVQAHDQAIARHEAVNQDQQQRQQESQGLVSGYPSKVTGITALTVPLAAWEGFTSLASHLPGEAGEKMGQMNKEAQQMQASFAQMGAQMLGVGSGGPARDGQLKGDEGRLQTTGQQAKASDKQLHTASEGATALQQSNQVAFSQASASRDAAKGQAQQCSDAATQKEQKATTLAQQLQAWAQSHKAARDAATAATEARLKGQGRIVLPRQQP